MKRALKSATSLPFYNCYPLPYTIHTRAHTQRAVDGL